jgi:hypothetical protein
MTSRFLSIRRLQSPWSEKKKELGTYHNLLAQVANVIETDVSDECIAKLARAA